jgi:hypothetical protein
VGEDDKRGCYPKNSEVYENLKEVLFLNKLIRKQMFAGTFCKDKNMQNKFWKPHKICNLTISRFGEIEIVFNSKF